MYAGTRLVNADNSRNFLRLHSKRMTMYDRFSVTSNQNVQV